MCGIVGTISKNNNVIHRELNTMVRAIAYRGPDAIGTKHWVLNDVYIGFGHARLSIIDIKSNSDQPMVREDLQLAITYNGEIYNYKEIKSELKINGYSFNTESDTEVILAAYHKWGNACVNQFIGMFAFAIYDLRTNSVVLFRDRAGVKPLYYHVSNKSIIFGSELKAILCSGTFDKKINNDALANYFKNGYVGAPNTIFENTYKLLAGHYIEIDLNSFQPKITKYWDVINFYNMDEYLDSEDVILENVETILKSAFNYRLISDVPVGVFLSGGYDSSAVAAILQSGSIEKLNTFSIGFDEKEYDEAPYAKEIARHLGTNHHEFYCSHEDALDLIEKLPDVYDEPFSDSSSIPTMMISKFTSDIGIKVALSGDGGDEIFNGYSKYYSNLNSFIKIARLSGLRKLILKGGINLIDNLTTYKLLKDLDIHRIHKLKNILNTTTFNQALRYKIEPTHFNELEIQNLILAPYKKYKSAFDRFDDVSIKKHPVDIMMAIDFQTVMNDDFLVKVDRASMRYGLEVREPFLDHRIIQYMARVPFNIKFKENSPKYILKKIVHKYVPQDLLNRPKKGFSIPKQEWLKGNLNEFVKETLDVSNLASNLSAKYVQEVVDKFYMGYPISEEKVWSLFMYQLWYNKWMQ
jgi:asparagine synthase (glutamine-hydrolysing)